MIILQIPWIVTFLIILCEILLAESLEEVINFSCESIPASYYDSTKHPITSQPYIKSHTSDQSDSKRQSIDQSDDDERTRLINRPNHRNGSIHSSNNKESFIPKNNQSNHQNGSVHQTNHKNGSIHRQQQQQPNGKKHPQTNGYVKSTRNTSVTSEV